jgi:membrane-associated protease RseP (regulator of RpoE activity)
VRAAREPGGAFLGVLMRPLTSEDTRRLGTSADHGVVVAGVMPDSPAAKAGLRRGDVITAVGGQPVRDPGELRHAIQQAGAGQEIALTVLRGQGKEEVKTRLEESPVEGIFQPSPLRSLTSRFFDPGNRLDELERRVNDLEKRLRDLEQRRGPEK